MSVDIAEVKRQAAGRWPDILATLGGIDRDRLDGRHHACPRCGGTDRFRAVNIEAGALFCNQCHNKQNGDGIAALQWLTGQTFPETLRMIAGHLGINGHANGNGHAVDVLTRVAREKRVSVESFQAYGAAIDRGAVVFPVFAPDGAQCSTFSIRPGDKGKFEKGKPAGLFLPVVDGQARLPQAGETWHLVEGVKDAAALHGLGLLAIGINRNELSAKFARLFRGVDVLIVPDRDTAGESGAQLTARVLYGVAASVRVAALPVAFQETGGKDVRDVLALADGEALLRQALEDAQPWRPAAIDDSRDGLPTVHLPGGDVPITQAAATFAELLGTTGRYFTRGGVPMRLPGGDEQRLEPIRPAGLCSDFETVARPVRTTKGKEGETITAPCTCPESAAKLILESAAFRSGLPPINVVSRCPVLIERGGQLVEVTGYDRDSGILAAGDPTPDVPLAEAVELLRGAVADFRFPTLGDKARALAAMITPGMVFGGLLGGRAPIDLGEADDTQAGKGFRNKITPVIYREAPKPVTQRTGGVGGLQESFDSRVVAGAPFLVIDNFRGSVDCPFLESYMTEDSYSARIPYAAPAAIDPRRTIVQFTSNAASTTVDAANRSSCVRILKQPSGYQFATFAEGDILDHVRANQPRFLGAVFSVVREWHRRGKPTLATVDHDFRRWAKVLGYIVADILKAGDLLEGHRAAQQRISSPGLNWLRDVALAVHRAGQTDIWLRPHNLLSIVLEAGIATEGIDPTTAEDDDGGWLRATRAIGRKLGKLFKGGERIDIDATHCMRREANDENHRLKTEYAFFTEDPQ